MSESEKAEALVEELKDLASISPLGSPSFHLAMYFAQQSDKDQAFLWIEKAIIDHEVEMYWLKVEPPFDPLRSNPRWQEMLDKVGFPD